MRDKYKLKILKNIRIFFR